MWFWKRPEVDLNIRNNFNIPELHKPSIVGRMNEVISAIVTAVASAIGTFLSGNPMIIVAGIGGYFYMSASRGRSSIAAAVVGLAVWSYTSSQKGSGTSKGGGSMLGGGLAIDQNGQLINTRQAAKVLPVVYGITKVGGNWVFSRPSDADYNIWNTVITWSEGEIEGLAPAIDFTPLYSGAGVNDIHTGGEFVSGACTCDGAHYGFVGCSCDMTCDSYS